MFHQESRFCHQEKEENERDEMKEETPLAHFLKDAGYYPEQVSAAIEACGTKTDISVLSDFIQAHFGNNEGKNTVSKIEEVGNTEKPYGKEDEDGVTLVFEKLRQMGFTDDSIQRAAWTLGSLDFEVLVQYLADKDYRSSSSEDEEYHDKVNEDCVALVYKRLKQMGFTDESIQRAAWDLGSLDFEALVGYLFEQGDYASQSSDDEKENIVSEAPPSPKPDKCNVIAVAGGTLRRHWNYPLVLDNEYQSVGSSSESEFSGVAIARREKKKRFGNKTGFGHVPRKIHPLMAAPPYFYFENVQSMPGNTWDTIKRYFHDIDPEFVDSKHFSASKRPRGYVHNLPTEGRELIIPAPPMTIQDALPGTRGYWPSWDFRTKLNCLITRRASDKLCNRIRNAVAAYEGMDLPLQEQSWILKQCKFWSLVWVGPGQVAPLEPHEIEYLLGFDHEHTRGSCTVTERYEALGNSFQVNTVAYHLSPLRNLYPQGMTILSLFAGIGGAEVALHKIGIFLKAVVCVEIKETNRKIVESWWRKTNQRGKLILKEDVRDLTSDVLSKLIDELGGFDLIIGGSPCNNFSGNNRVSRLGLQGEESCVFYEFPRILNITKKIMDAQNTKCKVVL